MVARAAQANMSVFRREGLLPDMDVARAYAALAAEFDNEFGNTKFCVMHTLREVRPDVAAARNVAELYEALGLVDVLTTWQQRHALARTAQPSDASAASEEPDAKRLCLQPLGDGVRAPEADVVRFGFVFLNLLLLVCVLTSSMQLQVFDARFAEANDTPKETLNKFCILAAIEKPVFTASAPAGEARFRAVCAVAGQQFTTRNLLKNKKTAEQAAALAALQMLNLFVAFFSG
jgi:tRNA-dihydrouridine synthase 2